MQSLGGKASEFSFPGRRWCNFVQLQALRCSCSREYRTSVHFAAVRETIMLERATQQGRGL